MPDDTEERRRKDLRDFEFYSRRVRPTVSDLLRTNELSRKNNKISLRTDKSSERRRGSLGLNTPSSLADIYADSRHGTTQGDTDETRPAPATVRSEIVWPLAAAALILVVADWTGNLDKVIEAIAF